MRVEVKLKVLKQFYARLMRRCEVPFTNKHTEVMENLLTLGTSHYRNKILVLMICIHTMGCTHISFFMGFKTHF